MLYYRYHWYVEKRFVLEEYMPLIAENGEWKIEGFTKEEPKDK